MTLHSQAVANLARQHIRMTEFKRDLQKIQSYYSSMNIFKDETQACFKLLFEFYESKYEETKQKLTEIFNFYKFDNYSKFSDSEFDIPELKFVYNGSEFSITLLLSYKNGVSDTNIKYGTIIEDPNLPIDLKFENQELEDKFYEKLWEYKFVTLHIWFSLLWRHLKLYSCGLKVNLSDGQCTDFFYLNDCQWKEESQVTTTSEFPIKNLISTDLTTFQIFKNLITNKTYFDRLEEK